MNTMNTMNTIQQRTILAIATFWVDKAGLELCPQLVFEKIAQADKNLSGLQREIEGLRSEIKNLRLNEARLEDKLKGAAIREKLLIEVKNQMQAFFQNRVTNLEKDVTYLKRLLMLCLCFSPLVLMVGFYLGKMAGA